MTAQPERQRQCVEKVLDGAAAESTTPRSARCKPEALTCLLGVVEGSNANGELVQEAGSASANDAPGPKCVVLDVPPEVVELGEIRHDHLGSTILDPAAHVPLSARVMIFALLCQGVQMFMSYDGGATPASLDTIQADMDNSWSPAEFGLLGAMDKIGMTATSMLWGRSLQLCNTKLLLSLGLLLNTVCTAIFGSLRSKGLMYAAKFFMGASQALQGVWATVWTVTMAPPDKKTMWIGLGAVSAGIGNGIGTAVAGLGTAAGLPYAFAFQLQAGVLALFLIYLIFVPSNRLSCLNPPPLENSESQEITRSREGPLVSQTDSQPVDQSPSAFKQLQEAWRNKVFCWTGLAISVTMFELSGLQFLWTRLFTEVWGLDKSWVTIMFLVVTGAGGGVGLALGPRYIDNSGGFTEPPGVVMSLTCVERFSFIGSAAGLLGIACLYGKMRTVPEDGGYLPDGGDHWLWLTWGSIFLIWAALNASIPALCGINVEVVPHRMRSFSSGTEMTLRNVLGYACGPFLPGIVMNMFEISFGWGSDVNGVQWTLCVGVGFVFMGTWLGSWVLRRATMAAQGALAEQKLKALEQLREALRMEDIESLEHAVAFARSVRLNQQRDGEAVLGMANEAIGAYHAIGRAAVEGSIALIASPSELHRRVVQLEREITRLRAENGELVLRLATHEDAGQDEQALLRSRSPGPQLALEAGELSLEGRLSL